MKTFILLFFPLLALSQDYTTGDLLNRVVIEVDTLPAILKVQQGNYSKYVKGYVVLTKDCKVVEYLRINTWRRKEYLFPMKENVVDHRLIDAPKL